MEWLVVIGVVIGIAAVTIADRRKQRRADAMQQFITEKLRTVNVSSCRTCRTSSPGPDVSAPPTVIKPDQPCCETFGD